MQTLFDTHCHLYNQPLAHNIIDVLTRARAAGVAELLVPGVDLASSRFAVELARSQPGVYGAVGYHPDAVDAAGVDTASLSALINQGGVCAIGEIGLDTTAGQPRGPQEQAFRLQLALAAEHNLPVLIHCRGAFGWLLEMVHEIEPRPVSGVLHAYAGSLEVARQLIEYGYFIGVAGVATRASATRVRSLVSKLPLDSLLLETDAPFIGTARHPKGQVEPADLIEVCQAVAQLKGISPEKIAEQTTANARTLFKSNRA
jgi:TatD DNase family protein